MSIYLTHNSKMLKADSARPGRYFGWFSHGHEGLLYLTYFTNNLLNTTGDYDAPVVRDPSIPLIQNVEGTHLLNKTIPIIPPSWQTAPPHTGLPTTFDSVDCIGVQFWRPGPSEPYTYYDTAAMNWNLPFGSSDKWSLTFRAYYSTDQYIQVEYQDPTDIDTYYLKPSVYIQGKYNDLWDYENIGTGDFRNTPCEFSDTSYPHKILSTFRQGDSELDRPTFPDGTTFYNGTDVGVYHDPGWPSGGTYPPAGRMFRSLGNDQVPQENGDQWYYTVIVGHGDGTISTYVNGERILNVPFLPIEKLVFYLGAKTFNAKLRYTSLEFMYVTEVSVWGKDLSYNNKNNVYWAKEPIYTKNGQGIYVPNWRY